jgi:opacity protein-like surface antigen
MRHIAQTMTFGLAILAVSSTAPRAADWVGSGGVIKDFGSVKDYRNAAVAVPAPRPAPIESAEWYVRADLGYNFASHGSIDVAGPITGSDMNDSADKLFGGVGIGRYISPGWRADFTFDARPNRRVMPKEQSYEWSRSVTVPAVGAVPAYTITGYNTAVHGESADTKSYAGLFNIYHDFEKSRGFTPYLGIGLGGGLTQLKRNYSEASGCTHYTDTRDVAPFPANLGCAPGMTGGQTAARDKGTMTWGLAAALMAGVTIDVAPGIKLDSSYRFLWEGTSASISGVNVEGKSVNLTVGDRFDHELRTGLRVDLN